MTTTARPVRRGAGARAGGPPPEINIVERPRATVTDPSRLEASPRGTAGVDGSSRGGSTEPDLAALRVWLRLLSCTNMIEQRVRARLRERFGTTLPRFDLLAQLDAAEREGAAGLSMTRLSRRLMVTNANVTALVARLEEEGLVRRVASPRDRRTQTVTLTRAGRRALDAMTPEHARWIEGMFAGIAADEREALHRLVGVLKSSVERATLEEGT